MSTNSPPPGDGDFPAIEGREELYRQIVESAHEGIWVVDGHNRTTFVNRRMAAMLGYSSREMIGRAMIEFVVAGQDDPDAGIGSPGSAAQREVQLRAFNGSAVWTLMTTSPLHGSDDRVVGALTMVTDISTRKRAEEALRQSEHRLKTIIDVEPACVKLVSEHGLLLEMNQAGLRMIEADSLAQVAGQPVVDLVFPDDRERFLSTHRSASAGHPGTTELRMVGLRGAQRWLEMHAVPFDTTGAEPGHGSAVLSVTHDLTERKRLEEQLHRSQKLEAVGRLAGGVAHDFNNLLTAVLGYCDLAEETLDKGHPALSELALIHAACERGGSLIEQMLAFSRQQMLNPRVIDLNATVSGLLRMLPRVIGEQITTTAQLDAQLTRVKADPTQLEQVLLNLAVNARDAMPGGGSLTIRTSNVHLTKAPVAGIAAFEPGPYVCLTVTDTGTGMDRETQALIFEPFFTTKDVGRGTGLGLATVYGIVKQSRGFVTVDSRLGEGTTFTIYLPATTAAVDDTTAQRPSTARGGRETVMLVEDSEAVLDLARRALERRGYSVLASGDSIEALNMVSQADGRIDLLVTDIVMPHLTGPELAQRVSRDWPSIRTLYISGYSAAVLAGHAGAHGHHRLLKKPFTPVQLVNAVREVLDQPQ